MRNEELVCTCLVVIVFILFLINLKLGDIRDYLESINSKINSGEGDDCDE